MSLEWVRDSAGIGGWVAESGGSSPAIDLANTIYLESNNPGQAIDGAPGEHRVLWDTIYDARSNVIGAIPAAMGLTLRVDSWHVDVDESGLWAAELMLNAPSDDTALVDVQVQFYPSDLAGGPRVQLPTVASAKMFFSQGEACLPWHGNLVAGDYILAQANVKVGTPTAVAYNPVAYGVLKIIRLA